MWKKQKNYIETNYSYPVTVEDVADYVGISRSHLFRSFQTYMNCSPKEFLSQYRIKQACRLLKETDLSVSAIAYSVGLRIIFTFSKAFRKQKQISPSPLQRKAQKLYRFRNWGWNGGQIDSGTGGWSRSVLLYRFWNQKKPGSI